MARTAHHICSLDRGMPNGAPLDSFLASRSAILFRVRAHIRIQSLTCTRVYPGFAGIVLASSSGLRVADYFHDEALGVAAALA